MSENAIVKRDVTAVSTAVSVSEVTQQVAVIQQILNQVMKKDEHYGVVPGCGDKPTLLQPGAQKIGLAFRLSPTYTIERDDLPNGHREYEITCQLHNSAGDPVGQGVGEATTMETKFRYRTQDTGNLVPKEYWEARDKSLLGGNQYSVRKVRAGNKQEWHIFEKVEHDNPADYYNTVKKMAKKRAYVDAITNTTACSDIFTQDLEDLQANGIVTDVEADPARDEPIPEPKKKQSSKPKKDTGKVITAKQGKLLYAKMKNKDMGDDAMRKLVKDVCGVDHSNEILMSQMDDIMEAIDNYDAPEDDHGDAYEEEELPYTE